MVEAMAKSNAPTLSKWGEKPKTLLLCQEDRAPDLTDEQIRKVFPFPYRFVSRVEYEKAIQETPTEYTFARNSWMGYGQATTVVFTLPTLEFLATGDSHDWDKGSEISLKDFKRLKSGLGR